MRAKARNMSRQEQFNNGLLTVADMDDEELRYGRMRDASGRIPRVTKTLENIPRDMYDAMVSEHAQRFDERLRQQLDVALDTMFDVMTDVTAEPKDKMEAAKWFVERARGKAAERVDITVRKDPVDELLGDVARLTKAQHEAMKRGAIDAEVVELPDDGLSESPQAQGDPPGVPAGHADLPREPTSGDWLADAIPAETVGQESFEHVGDSNGPELVRRGVPTVSSGPDPFDGYAPFEPPELAPTHIEPATSNPVEAISRSQAIAAAQEQASKVAEARKVMSKLRTKAKSSRKAQRAMGTDVLRKSLRETGFAEAQNSFLVDIEDDASNTADNSGADG